MTNSLHWKRPALAISAALFTVCFALTDNALAQTATSAAAASASTEPVAISPAATSAAATPAANPDPSLLLINKKKRHKVKAPDAAKPPVTDAAASADQPPVALDTGKAAPAAPDPIPPEPAADVATIKPVPAETPSQAVDPVAADAPASAAAVDVPAAPMGKKKHKLKMAAKPAVAKPANTAKATVVATPAAPDAADSPPATADTATAPAKKAAGRKTASIAAPAAGPLGASGCRTRSFLVNDYGKDGPTADAKRLLADDIASWSKANGLKNTKITPKGVSCTQFLNFIVFDEWTCTASAQVCWQ